MWYHDWISNVENTLLSLAERIYDTNSTVKSHMHVYFKHCCKDADATTLACKYLT